MCEKYEILVIFGGSFLIAAAVIAVSILLTKWAFSGSKHLYY